MEGVQRPRPRRQARPDRVGARAPSGPHLRVRRVRSLAIRPVGGSCWAPAGRPQRQPANYHKLHGVRQFHGCYSVGDDELWGVVRRQKSAANTLKALRSIRARRPDGDWIYVIRDNLSAHKGPKIREWTARNKVELCFTPTYSSWANPIEAHFAPLREFVLNNSNYPNHVVLTCLTRRLQARCRAPRSLRMVATPSMRMESGWSCSSPCRRIRSRARQSGPGGRVPGQVGRMGREQRGPPHEQHEPPARTFLVRALVHTHSNGRMVRPHTTTVPRMFVPGIRRPPRRDR